MHCTIVTLEKLAKASEGPRNHREILSPLDGTVLGYFQYHGTAKVKVVGDTETGNGKEYRRHFASRPQR